MPNLAGAQIKERGKELKPARLFAFKLWQENPQITGAQLDRAVKDKGFEASKSICYLWLKTFRKGKGISTSEEKPVTAMEGSELTLEQIIKAAGSVETLSVLFYQGVMREMARKDAANHLLKQECVNKDKRISDLKYELNEVTRDRNRVMREYNEKLAKVKVGTLTFDETKRRLISKL